MWVTFILSTQDCLRGKHFLCAVFSPFLLSAILKEVTTTTMILKNYDLDFSGQSGVPSQWGLTLPQVVQLFSKQMSGLSGYQLVKDKRRRGVFEVTAYTQEAVNRLSTFKLKVSKEGRDIELPLKEKKNGKRAIWVSINGTTWGKMASVPNDYFDGVLKESGATIKVETKRRFHRGTTIYNGQREALVELGESPIERQHFWTDDDGKDHGWWLTYRGQPYSCSRCEGAWHDDGNCPKWDANRRDDANEGQQKLLVFSTSFLRHAKDTKTARFDCVPGAQIGHIANHLENDATILPKADVVVVAAGQNMGGDVIDVTKRKTKAQGKVLVRALKEYSDRDKKIYVVDPVIGVVSDGDENDESRFLRAEMRRMATDAGGRFVPMDNLNLEEADMADAIHLSETGTRRYLTVVRNFIKADIGTDVFGDIATSAREYAGQRLRHYKVGCPKCTFIHVEKECPSLRSDDDSEEGDDDNDDDDDATEAKQRQEEDDDDADISSRSRRKTRGSTQQERQSDAGDSSPEAPDAGQATPEAMETASTLDLAAAAPSFAAAVASTPGRQLPNEPRMRSTSSKRGSDGEQTRADSLKRQKTETELEVAIRQNRQTLIDAGMDGKQQDTKWKGLKGVQLYNKQTSMIRQVCAIPNMFKKGGRR